MVHYTVYQYKIWTWNVCKAKQDAPNLLAIFAIILHHHLVLFGVIGCRYGLTMVNYWYLMVMVQCCAKCEGDCEEKWLPFLHARQVFLNYFSWIDKIKTNRYSCHNCFILFGQVWRDLFLTMQSWKDHTQTTIWQIYGISELGFKTHCSLSLVWIE